MQLDTELAWRDAVSAEAQMEDTIEFRYYINSRMRLTWFTSSDLVHLQAEC